MALSDIPAIRVDHDTDGYPVLVVRLDGADRRLSLTVEDAAELCAALRQAIAWSRGKWAINPPPVPADPARDLTQGQQP